MTVKLKNGKAASEEAVRALEAALRCRVSHDVRAFFRSSDGAEPETNIFTINARNESGVNQFIPATQIAHERSRIESISATAYPIAWAEGGNYVLIDEGRAGAVFFWDHEAPDDQTQLAGSFDEFLAALKPFDAKSVELKPGQVKRMWVDPEFLKQLKKK